MQRGTGRVRALDGLRGVAIGCVLLGHALQWWRFAYSGVVIFFVLSGYLITSLLAAEQAATGRIDLPAFWRRRARRLGPALLAVLAVVTVIQLLLGPPPGLAADLAQSLFLVANLGMLDLQFVPALRQLWSLAVEEQFYLLWPLVLLALPRAGRERVRHWLLIGAGASLAARGFSWGWSPELWSQWATPSVAFYLLVGCWGALATPRQRRLLGHAAWLLPGCLLLMVPVGRPWTLAAWDLAVTPLLAVASLGAVLRAVDRGSRLLSLRPVVGLGVISYSVYLWQPVLSLSLPDPPPQLQALGCLLAVPVGAASRRWIERPALRRDEARQAPAGPDVRVVEGAAST